MTATSVLTRFSREVVSLATRIGLQIMYLLISVLTPFLALIGTITFLAFTSWTFFFIAVVFGIILLSSIIYVIATRAPHNRRLKNEKTTQQNKKNASPSQTLMAPWAKQFFDKWSDLDLATKILTSVLYFYLLGVSLWNYIRPEDLPIFKNPLFELMLDIHHFVFDDLILSPLFGFFGWMYGIYTWLAEIEGAGFGESIPVEISYGLAGVLLTIGGAIIVGTISES